MSSNYNRQDSYYKKAKAAGFRSRAYYKLDDIQKKYKLIKSGDRVLDLGAWPGGWMQCAAKHCGSQGLVCGIDLVPLDEFERDNIHILTGDVRDEQIIQQACTIADGHYDVLLSDMSPKLSGIKEADRLAAVGLVELAFWVAGRVLKNGGSFVAKVFKSNEAEEFYRQVRPSFEKLQRQQLDSTRKTSNEFYLVGTGFNRNNQE